MKRFVVCAAFAAAFLMAAVPNRAPAEALPGVGPAPEAGSLFDLLPESTLVAAEVRDVARRWAALREIPVLARFQDHVLDGSGLEPDDLPLLAGDRATLALVPSRDGRTVIPIAVLRPPDLDRAEAILDLRAGARPEGGTAWCRVRGRNALWVGPASAAGDVASIARGDGTSLSPLLPFDEAAAMLPAGGLVRGWVNPAGVRRYLRRPPAGTRPAPVEWLAASLAAELDAARWIAFRRDLTDDKLVTDAALVYDGSLLPAEVARVFDPSASSPALPTDLPRDVVLAAAFRPEGDACLPWLRFVASADPDGPLRNFDFWTDEFEERSGRSLERDLFDLLGEHAWTFVLESPGDAPLTWVNVFEVREGARAEATLFELREWASSYLGLRTLGFAHPKHEELLHGGTRIHATRIRTALGTLSGPAFAVTGGHLVVGIGDRGVRAALDLVASGRLAGPAIQGNDPAAHASVIVRGPALARALLRAQVGHSGDGREGRILAAAAELLDGIPEASIRVRYTPDGLDVHGEIPLRNAP